MSYTSIDVTGEVRDLIGTGVMPSAWKLNAGGLKNLNTDGLKNEAAVIEMVKKLFLSLKIYDIKMDNNF